ncbi:hypothetical protein BJX99DRAFT_267812 [Aspergillus californicus]
MLSRRLWGFGSVPKTSTAYRIRFTMSSLAMGQVRQKSSYLLKAVEMDENQRLDIQHRMNIHMMNHKMLHPDIPKNLGRVADIATGNGTWLFDLIKARKESESEAEPTSESASASASRTHYHGFDISPALFPKKSPDYTGADIAFSVHDFFLPFPEEHIGQYDLVHARHLSLAIPAKDIDLAMKNITSLLKPGGHIQWEEYDYRDQLSHCPPSTMTTTWKTILQWVADHGYSMEAGKNVHDSAVRSGLEIVENKQFTTQGLPFCEEHRLTLLYAFDTGVPRQCLRGKGMGESEVEAVIGECLGEWEDGVLVDYYLSRVVGRRGVE